MSQTVNYADFPIWLQAPYAHFSFFSLLLIPEEEKILDLKTQNTSV